MSDQEKGHGHHAITKAAVDRLFDKVSPADKILGLDRNDVFQRLDFGQAFADRSPLGGQFKDTPFGIGDTWQSSQLNPDAQRAHSMADPNKTGAQNLRDINEFVVGKLKLAYDAHHTGKHFSEWISLGAAVHALEDSYSSAHVFRDIRHPGDPHSHIQAFNNFDGLPQWLSGFSELLALFGHRQTHDGAFDQVFLTSGYLERASDRAAAAAVEEALSTYFQHLSDDPPQAHQAFTETISAFFQGNDIQVFTDNTALEFLQQRLAHYENEVCGHSNGTTEGGHAGNMSYDPGAGLMSHDPGAQGYDPGMSYDPGAGLMSHDPGAQGHDYGMSYDPGAGLMSHDPGAQGHDHGMSYDPGAGLMSHDPGAQGHDHGMSYDPGAGLMSHDPGAQGYDPGMSYDPGAGLMSHDPGAQGHDHGMSYDPGAGLMSHDPGAQGYDPGMSYDPGAGLMSHDPGAQGYDPGPDGIVPPSHGGDGNPFN